MIQHTLYQSLPRVKLLAPTPLAALPNLGRHLGGIKLYVKRDDIGLLGGGGNKLRKLELLAAQAQGCDTLITFGALQSNHARLTAAVAAHLGMACHLVLNCKVARQGPHYETSGNQALNRLLGAHCHRLAAEEDPLAFAAALRDRLESQGRRVATIAFGGSDAYGSLGYVRCIEELAEQAEEQGIRIDHLVHASGSGGTQAGLVLGAHLQQAAFRIEGISVLHNAADLAAMVRGLVYEAAAVLALDGEKAAAGIQVDDGFVGRGYGLADDKVYAAMALAARREGLLLDPVYTGKAFAGLVARARQGRYRAGDTVVFLHTGGLPGIFAYADEIAASAALAAEDVPGQPS
ncbi:MAG: D-cysteine desulfhydrase family protein [Castellaniella sp.]